MVSSSVTVFEVGPRDGLQNEKIIVPLKDKVRFIQDLLKAGARELEVGAFVRPDRVPQMADSDQVLKFAERSGLRHRSGRARFWSLVPNERGLERALCAGASNFAVFTGATESFTQRNIGMSIRESIEGFRRLIQMARAEIGGRARFRGYVSVALGCPFEGRVPPKQVLRVVEKVAELGVVQVSVGDTIGIGTPRDVDLVFRPAIRALGASHVAAHFHDTRGIALANALRAFELGVRTFDSSAGGFGGCPFAPGAAGNLATEDLVYMLEGMGIRTGIDLDLLCEASLRIARKMKRALSSRYLQAFASSHGVRVRCR